MPDKKQELKECPFCDGEAQLKVLDRYYYARCGKCGAKAKVVYDTEAEAIAAWNTRQPDKELIEALEGVMREGLILPIKEPCCTINRMVQVAKRALAKYQQ